MKEIVHREANWWVWSLAPRVAHLNLHFSVSLSFQCRIISEILLQMTGVQTFLKKMMPLFIAASFNSILLIDGSCSKPLPSISNVRCACRHQIWGVARLHSVMMCRSSDSSIIHHWLLTTLFGFACTIYIC